MSPGDAAEARPAPRGFLLELDGTVYEGETLVPGADVAALPTLLLSRGRRSSGEE